MIEKLKHNKDKLDKVEERNKERIEELKELVRKSGKDGYKEALSILDMLLECVQDNCDRTAKEILVKAKRYDTEHLIVNVQGYVDFMNHIHATAKTVRECGEVLFDVMMENIPDEQKEKEKPNKCFGMFDESDPVCFCCEYSEACRDDVGTINE